MELVTMTTLFFCEHNKIIHLHIEVFDYEIFLQINYKSSIASLPVDQIKHKSNIWITFFIQINYNSNIYQGIYHQIKYKSNIKWSFFNQINSKSNIFPEQKFQIKSKSSIFISKNFKSITNWIHKSHIWNQIQIRYATFKFETKY